MRSRRRLLVLANETLESTRARAVIADEAGPSGDVVVVVPALHRNRLEHWLGSGTERARAEAEGRLSASLAALRDAGLVAQGGLGDADPLQALDDAVRVHRPDAVVVCTHPPHRSRWIERGLVDRVRARSSVPVTHLVVDVDRDTVEVSADPRGRGRGERSTLRLFARLDYGEAMRVRRSGFRTSVRMSDRPPPGDGDGVTFAVDLPREEVPAGAIGGSADVPPGLLNRHGPPMLMDDWSE